MTDDNPRVRAAVEAASAEMAGRADASYTDSRTLAYIAAALRAYDAAQCRHDPKWVCAHCDNRSDICTVNGEEVPR